MFVETTTYLLEASLRKGETVTDTMDWPFQVLTNSPIEAADILREYLLHPERTGIRYKECVGITPICTYESYLKRYSTAGKTSVFKW
mgnify:CR=1 FL=1